MTEEIKVIPTNGTSADDVKYAKKVEEIYIDGVNVAGCEFYFKDKKYSCDLSFINQEELCKCDDVQDCTYKQLKQAENTVNECHKYLAELEDKIESLEQENKSLYEEKNCLHKIIDRLLENAGYSKDIASAEDFEDVYEDMQRKINELAELEQENKDLKKQIESDKGLITVGGKQQYEYLQRIDELKKTVENQKLEYEELQCDLSEVENACGCYQSENAELKQENKKMQDILRSILSVIRSKKIVEEVKLNAIKIKIERYFEKAQKGVK